MKRWQVIVAALGVAVVIAGAVGGGLVWFTGGSGEASEPISAPTLAVAQSTPTESPAPAATQTSATRAATTAPAATQAPTTKAAATATSPPTPKATEAAATTPTPVEATPTAAAFEPAGEKVLFRIVQAESRVRFEIDEILRDSPKRVVGITDQVAGDLIIDFASPQDSQLGTLRINVRTLQTDDGRRDRAIRSRILQSAEDAYEFVEFEPTSLAGLPEGVAVGDELQFTIVGTLTIREISAEVAFDAVVAVESDGRVSGSAVATIQREAFDLTIPSVPFVASVGEDVLLAIDFAAEAVDG